MQHFTLDIDVNNNVRFRIVQLSGTRVNIDDITIFGRQPQPEHLKGDVNDDGEVNIADINALMGDILSGVQHYAYDDVNEDGEINIADVNEVIDIILNM